MGSVVNPVLCRLGYAYDWLLDSSINYLNISIETRMEDFVKYIKEVMYGKGAIRMGFILSGIKVKLMKESVIVEISLYTSIPFFWMLRERLAIVEKRIILAGFSLFKKPIKVVYYFLDDSCISASCLTTYIYMRLKKRIFVHEIFKELRYYLKKLKKWKLCTGYKILCKGRFSRKQRAQKKVMESGPLPVQHYGYVMDLCQKTVILKYGISNLKVWLFRRKIKRKYDCKLML